MSDAQQDESEKSHEATPQKLQKARKKGDVAKSNDLMVAASYAGILLTALAVGAGSLHSLGTALMVLLDQPDRLGALVLGGPASAPIGGLLITLAKPLTPWFLIPALLVLLSVLGQRAFVVAPDKIKPKLSRISLIANAKNKFGRSGLFEFAKSFCKLILYSVCLGLFLDLRLTEIVAVTGTSSMIAVSKLLHLCVEFLFLVLLIATVIGGIDAVWQHKEHLRKNMMSRKEITDESKEAEGDPHMKQQRRQRGQEIAMNRMMSDVPTADVVVVNPTHYAVALKWDRKPGSAPVCVAKGVDEVAARIRETAQAAGVPIHSDPPTARALHATVDLGHEILEEQYMAVAAAIQFAEKMRHRARGGVV